VDATGGVARQGRARIADATGTGARANEERTKAMMRTEAPGSRQRDGYEHIAPLFVVYRALPAAHPLRSRLREELISGYHPLALHIARRFARRGESPEDLAQVASLGLILAVDRFDPDRGSDFLSFAVPTITGEVQRHFRDRAAPIRVPRRLREMRGPIYEAGAELSQRLGRAPRPSEIADELGVDVELVVEALVAESSSRAMYLDQPVRHDDGSDGTGASLAATLPHVDTRYDLVEYRESLRPLLKALPERERTILLLRFFGDLTQTEIGQRVGVSQMHVSRLLTRTLRSLRTQLIAG
jgi:RNA polymerase sigma-B factor